ncbi:hypothetical protein D3C85_1691700 [compost metagenome]
MARHNRLTDGHAFLLKDFASEKRSTCDKHIIQRVQTQHSCCAGFHDQFHRILTGCWVVRGHSRRRTFVPAL